MKMNKKGIKIAGTMALCFMVLAGYAAIAADDTPRAKKNNGQEWMNVTLEDVTTGEKFTISDFNGKVVVLETFAVWCPTCTKQQKEIKKLHGKAAGVISITVDIDPNESADKVRSHVERYGFDWPYAVAPPAFTKSLVEEFGTVVASAPSAPVIVISEDGSARLLGRGVKSADKLAAELKKR